jgi:hypothetical protein
MKKSIVASIIGVVATVAAIESSYGQGSIFFTSYGASTDAIVKNPSNQPVSAGYTAQLAYGFGTITDPAALTLSGITQAFNPAVPGYFTGGIVTIPGYAGGPITFQVLAYDGTGYGSATTTFQGTSTLFTLPSIATGTQPVGEFGPALLAFSVQPVPEPSTLALFGLGTAALLFLRRRK